MSASLSLHQTQPDFIPLIETVIDKLQAFKPPTQLLLQKYVQISLEYVPNDREDDSASDLALVSELVLKMESWWRAELKMWTDESIYGLLEKGTDGPEFRAEVRRMMQDMREGNLTPKASLFAEEE